MNDPLLLPKVAVLGASIQTPLGADVGAVCDRLLAGERAAAVSPRFPAATYPCRLAAVLPAETRRGARSRYLKPMAQAAVATTVDAVESARRHHPAVAALPGSRIGLFFGYGGLRAYWEDLMQPLGGQRDDLEASWERGMRNLHPFFMLQRLSNNAQALAAESLRIFGDSATLAGANAGAQALTAAQAALAEGAVDVAVVTAYDTLIEPEVILDLGMRGVLSGAATVEDLASPYDEAAGGAVPGEASATLILSRDEALGPASAALQAVEGADASAGAPAATLLGRLASPLLARQEVAVFDGAALALPAIDKSECTELALLHAAPVLTATQSALGQLGAAAPLVQTALLSELLRRGVLPAIAGLRTPVAGRPRLLVENTPTAALRAVALSAGAPGLAGAVLVEVRR